MAVADLTAQRLRELVSYDPIAGTFTWAEKARKPGSPVRMSACDGYMRFRVDGYNVWAHRMAILHVVGALPGRGFHVDHINGNRSDNRLSNLRVVPMSINPQNVRKPKADNTSGYLGAFWHKKQGRWRSQIRLAGKSIHLGYFETAEQAHEAFVAAKRKLHVACTI